jgi:hypothetical protein
MKSIRTAGTTSYNFLEERKMKTAKTILASSIFLGMAIGTAQAEVCYRLVPFTDILRLSRTDVVDTNAGGTHRVINGNWISRTTSAQAALYTLPVAGSLELNTGSTAVLRLGIHGTNHVAAAFTNHSSCTLDGVPGAALGTAVSCVGRAPGVFIGGASTLTIVSCAGLAASGPEEAGGKAIGE